MPQVFKVHYQATKPGPSWTAWRRWQSGLLIVGEDSAEFRPRESDPVVIRNVTDVSQPSRSELRHAHDISWMVATWIAVRYAAAGQVLTAYFNDARFWGYGHYLNHRSMRASLDGLVRGQHRT